MSLFHKQIQNNALRKTKCSDLHLLVEMRGIEPLSENRLPRLSTSVAGVFKFPPQNAHGQAFCIGSL